MSKASAEKVLLLLGSACASCETAHWAWEYHPAIGRDKRSTLVHIRKAIKLLTMAQSRLRQSATGGGE